MGETFGIFLPKCTTSSFAQLVRARLVALRAVGQEGRPGGEARRCRVAIDGVACGGSVAGLCRVCAGSAPGPRRVRDESAPGLRKVVVRVLE